MIDLAIVSDIHHGPRPTPAWDAPAALPLLRRALAEHGAGADALVDLGDRIRDVDHATDLRLLAEVADACREVALPRHHLLGNHDVAHLTAEENARALDARAGSYGVELGGLRLVFWQADTRFVDLASGLRVADGDLAWLREATRAAGAPTMVFSHFPLDGAAMTGNPYFDGPLRHLAGYTDTDRVLDVLRAAPGVVACVAGHAHWNRLSTIDGIHFITAQSLTETFTTAPHPAGAIARLTVVDGWLTWTTHGNDPVDYRLPLRPRGRRWTRMSPPPAPAGVRDT